MTVQKLLNMACNAHILTYVSGKTSGTEKILHDIIKTFSVALNILSAGVKALSVISKSLSATVKTLSAVPESLSVIVKRHQNIQADENYPADTVTLSPL